MWHSHQLGDRRLITRGYQLGLWVADYWSRLRSVPEAEERQASSGSGKTPRARYPSKAFIRASTITSQIL